MIEQDDTAGRAGSPGLAMAGAGLPSARNCMPCGRHLLNQIGGGMFTWRGVRNVWHCSSCKAVRAERMKAMAAV